MSPEPLPLPRVRRWPWILAVLVATLPGVLLTSALDDREQHAREARADAVAIATAVDDTVRTLEDLSARLTHRDFARVYPPTVKRMVHTKLHHLDNLERIAEGPEVERLRATVAWVSRRVDRPLPRAGGTTLFRAGAAQINAASDAVARTQEQRARRAAAIARAGRIIALVATISLMFALLAHSRRLLLGVARRHAVRLRHLADHDPLTGLRNRRRLEGDVVERIAAAGPLRDMRVLQLDLDGFKAYNDRAGHAAGDDLLRDVADALREASAPRGACYRLGGDEFCVLAPDDEADLAKRVEAGITRVAGERGVTASVGEAHIPHDSATVGEALALADARMYEAKARRRRRRATDAA